MYQMCFVTIPKDWSIIHVSILFAFGKHFFTSPLFFELNRPPVPLDIAVFILVIAQMQYMKATHRGIKLPSVLNAVSRDTGVYFAIIASSHFLVVVMYSVARVGLFVRVLGFNAY